MTWNFDRNKLVKRKMMRAEEFSKKDGALGKQRCVN
jgi:hypothetical protein